MSPRETVELQVVAERILPPVEIVYDEPPAGGRTMHEALWNEEGRIPTPVIPRVLLAVGEKLTGPAVLHEIGATTALPPGATAEILNSGAILVNIKVSNHQRGA
jgi:N-methylhydantoinase A